MREPSLRILPIHENPRRGSESIADVSATGQEPIGSLGPMTAGRHVAAIAVVITRIMGLAKS